MFKYVLEVKTSDADTFMSLLKKSRFHSYLSSVSHCIDTYTEKFTFSFDKFISENEYKELVNLQRLQS